MCAVGWALPFCPPRKGHDGPRSPAEERGRRSDSVRVVMGKEG